MRGFIIVMASALAVAGCLAPPTTSDEDGADRALRVVGAGISLDGTPDVAPRGAVWGTVSLEVSGPPGSWVTFFQPLPTATDSLEIEIDLRSVVHGDAQGPVALFTVPPQPVFGAEAAFLDIEDASASVAMDGTSAERSLRATQRFPSLGQPISGIFGAFGGTGAWNASLRASISDAGPVVGPEAIFASGNATVAADVSRWADGHGPTPAATVRLETDVPGWTHAEYQAEHVDAGGVLAGYQTCTVSFGNSATDCSSRYADAPALPGISTAGWGRIGHGGPGEDAALAVEFVGTTLEVRAIVMHLPFEDVMFPEGLEPGGYALTRFIATNEPAGP